MHLQLIEDDEIFGILSCDNTGPLTGVTREKVFENTDRMSKNNEDNRAEFDEVLTK
ncbi:hypothetical protein [Salinibaculum rarum]|uniref:hypothetical protein n=1 Tax=Salinibaculum rarum TaxID=3058903 RepID=UPI00265E0AD6|nr:hypothetical protein [Salinibaculum sp. KK48]